MNDSNSLYKSQDSFTNVMDYFSSMGFQKKLIWEAWKNTNHRQNLMLEEILRLTSEQGSLSQIQIIDKKDPQLKDDSLIQKAISLSLKSFTYETNTEDFLRQDSNPVGLVNLGRKYEKIETSWYQQFYIRNYSKFLRFIEQEYQINKSIPTYLFQENIFIFSLPNIIQQYIACYFNVIIQTLFSIKELRDLLLNINLDEIQNSQIANPSEQLTADKNSEQQEEKQKLINMVRQFQNLFACLLKGKKSNQNPRELFDSLKALNGECFKIGEENDFWEFQNSTLELLEKSFSKLYNLNETSLKNITSVNQLFLSKLMPLSIQNNFFSQNPQDQQKNPSSLQSSNPMTDLFYGKIQECITYKEGQNDFKKYNEYVQGIVSLEVKHGDLYKALEASQVFEIPDYEVSAGVKTKAKVENKFKKAPQILNFNINRLDFDRKNLCTVKLNNQFYFEKELTFDNFCVSDDQLEGNLSRDEINHLSKLNRQITKIENKLKECQNPNCAPIQLQSCFDNVMQFLKRQESASDEFIDIDDYEMELEKADGVFGMLGSKAEIQTTLKILSKYKDQISNQAESLNQKLEKLRRERWQIYKKSKNNFYELFSILMHEGTADSGHYYCYIWDELSGKWYKYNDSTVTVAVEEDLLLEAYGKPDSTKNACCLFYRNRLHKTDYSKISEVPSYLKKVVADKDKQFLDQIDKQKVLNALEPFKRKLASEIAKRQALITKNKDTLQCVNDLSSFENFLLSLEQFKHFGFREILINMLNECDQTYILKELKDPNNLEGGIEEFFQLFEKTHKMPPYKIPDSQICEYQTLQESHNLLINLLKEFEGALQTFNSIEQYAITMKSLGSILMNINDMNPYIRENSLLAVRLSYAVSYMLQVQLLRGCFVIDCLLQKQDTKNLIAITNIMAITLMTFFLDQELLKKQIELNLKHTLETHGSNPKIFTNKLFKEFQHSIEKIPVLKSIFEKNIYNLRDIFKMQHQEDGQSKQNMVASLLNNWENQLNKLTLWRSFLDKICSQHKLISNTDRLDQEEILYSQFM